MFNQLISYVLIYLRNYFLTFLLTPWSTALLEKITGSQLVKKFAELCGKRRFITPFASARHLSLSWASSIQFIPPHPNSWIFFGIIFLSTPAFPQFSHSLKFPHPNSIYTSLANARYMPCPSHSSWSVYYSEQQKHNIYIQGVPGGKDLTSGECSLGQTIPI